MTKIIRKSRFFQTFHNGIHLGNNKLKSELASAGVSYDEIKKMDTNGDGVINHTELRKVYNLIEKYDGGRSWKFTDKGKSGKIYHALSNSRGQGGKPIGYQHLDDVRKGNSLQKGAKGPGVRVAQQLLSRMGYKIGIDGDFGPQTRRTVIAFQRKAGLKITGKIDQDTVKAFDKAFCIGKYDTEMKALKSAPVNSSDKSVPKVVHHARKYLGVSEATNHDDGAPAYLFSGGRKVPWCANFVKTIYKESGIDLPGEWNYQASATYMYKKLKSEGTILPPGSKQVKPGDIIFFKFNKGTKLTDHVGIVEKVGKNGVVTIEGNDGQKRVGRHKYKLNSKAIVGYGRP